MAYHHHNHTPANQQRDGSNDADTTVRLVRHADDSTTLARIRGAVLPWVLRARYLHASDFE